MRILTGSDISSILLNLTPDNARQLLDALSSALASYYEESNSTAPSSQTIIQPPRVVFQCKQKDGENTVLTMPVSDTSSTVVKVATVPAKGNIAGAITIYSGETGELEGLLNAAEITAFRTALASMTILTRWKAPTKPSICVFGGGKQAGWHVRLALLLVPGIQQVTVVNRSKARLEKVERGALVELRHRYPDVKFSTIAQEGNESYQEKLRSALSSADIICGCTPSTEPLFTFQHLENGPAERFIALIGSYKPHMQEIDTETVKAAREDGKVYVDLKDACLEEAGELIKADFGKDDLIEIGHLFSREKDGNKTLLPTGRKITLFKCVGFGFMDLVVSKSLLEMAKAQGKGMVIDAF